MAKRNNKIKNKIKKIEFSELVNKNTEVFSLINWHEFQKLQNSGKKSEFPSSPFFANIREMLCSIYGEQAWFTENVGISFTGENGDKIPFLCLTDKKTGNLLLSVVRILTENGEPCFEDVTGDFWRFCGED